MKNKYIYIILVLVIVITLIFINKLIISNRMKNIYNSIVYIESIDEEIIKNGSGFVYETKNNKNYIITSYHVVEGCKNIYVYNNKKNKEEAKIVNYDEQNDIVILSITNNLGLKNVKLGNSNKIKLGEDIFTLGTPLNIDYISTLNKGNISYINRKIELKTTSNTRKFNTIQLDINIEEGNSGGPVLNKFGKVIGMVFVKEANADTIAFALPINFVIDIVNLLEENN